MILRNFFKYELNSISPSINLYNHYRKWKCLWCLLTPFRLYIALNYLKIKITKALMEHTDANKLQRITEDL